jgi:hypothetical protein
MAYISNLVDSKLLNLHSKYARPVKEATTGQKDRTRAGKKVRFMFPKYLADSNSTALLHVSFRSL